MELNSTINDRINILLADPAQAQAGDAAMLLSLVEQYPYFKPAHLLLARATQNQAVIEKAVLYSNGQLCYDILHKEFKEISGEQIMAPVQEVTPVTLANTEPPITSLQDEQETFEEISEETPIAEAVLEDTLAITTDNEQPTTSAPDEQETFDEISEFDISEFVQEATGLDEEPVAEKLQPTAREEEILHWEPRENVPANSFPDIETVVPDEPEHAQVSKYDDDNLPYTFLWWLAKTRAAHQQVFQPYAAPRKQQEQVQASGELQQQYVEHIFHLQTGLGENITGVDNEVPHKEDGLINAFLEKDPQIKPPPVDKLDNENKARKSAEDHNDVVSETLAAIYIEQMLYRKAIDTYEKLSLKFPEKSRYFADLIKSLEKKI